MSQITYHYSAYIPQTHCGGGCFSLDMDLASFDVATIGQQINLTFGSAS